MNNKYETPVERFIPSENLSNRVEVPDNTLLVITNHDSFNHLPQKYIQDLKGEIKRDWFIQHAYFCLPLKIDSFYSF